ncbi:hypothetical protein AMTR_s00154p00094610 [Amborella trichopoda]|uniref:Major facilitator superfamily (MFS) profile domain-containing protein n=1 Tax=Amborella trichopoda TaxID=13333 RepID=W1PIM1_AMBTC|nr:hypothetical protein AMTR_s00154p00094610 [Amborella trichopoda]
MPEPRSSIPLNDRLWMLFGKRNALVTKGRKREGDSSSKEGNILDSPPDFHRNVTVMKRRKREGDSWNASKEGNTLDSSSDFHRNATVTKGRKREEDSWNASKEGNILYSPPFRVYCNSKRELLVRKIAGPVFTSDSNPKIDGDAKVTFYVLLCALISATGGLMFGYDIGISGSTTSRPCQSKEEPQEQLLGSATC